MKDDVSWPLEGSIPAYGAGGRSFLSRAAEALSSSAAFEDALGRTIGAALPELADFGFFDVIDGHEVRRTAAAHASPDVEAILRGTQWARQERDDMNLCALSTGQPALHVDINEAWYARVAAGPEHLAVLRQLAFTSMISVPMRLRGELVGALTLFMGRSGRQHTREHLAAAQDLASLAAPIVMNARLIERHEKAEAALLASEERLRLALMASDLGIWDWDILNDRVTWSEKVYQLHGLALGDFNGRLQDFEKFIHPDDGEKVSAELQAALKGRSPYDIEFRVVHPDGTVRWLATKAEVHRGREGQPIRMLGATFDVTSRVELLAAERAARARAEQADRAKDEFLAMLGHELRNPLAPIVTALKLMSLKGDDALAAERALIERHVSTLTRLVDDLLDVARIARGDVVLKRTMVSLQQVLRQAVEIAAPLFEVRRHHLELTLPQQEVVAFVDECRLAQVIANLLINAARYTPEGGCIELCLTASGTRCCIAVRDNGVGIDPAMLPKVFDLFFQGEQGPDRARGGLGVGLAIVKNLVRLHEGTVTARSDGHGRGSTFLVDLPIIGEDAAQLNKNPTTANMFSPQSLSSTEVSEPFRVLIVDDNQDAAETLAVMLELNGFVVKVETDPVDALRIAREFRPHLAVLDIGLPGMDGHELGRRLLAAEHFQVGRLIALSGYGTSEDRARSREAGFHDHLVKPIDPDLFVAKVNEQLAELQAR